MKNLNYINHEIGSVWHDFCVENHTHTNLDQKSKYTAVQPVLGRGSVIPTVAESPANHPRITRESPVNHPLITRLSPANHPLLAVFNQVKRVMRAAMVLLMLFVGVGQMWALDIYLDTHNFTDWTSSSATFKLWPGTGSDITGTQVTTNLYKFSVTSATGTMYFKRYDSGGSSQWNEFSVSYNSSYNAYKVTGWNAGSCANYNVSNATKTHYIYFDNSTTGWSNSYKYFVIGHDNPTAYSKVYSMSALSHTKLWYVSQSSDSWTDLTYYAICSPTSSWSGTSWGSSNISNANKYAAPYKDKYDMNNGSSYLFTPASSSNNCALTIDYKNGYSALNYSQTVKKYTCTAEDDGSLASQFKNADINSGTVTISAYKLTGNGTVSNTSNSATLDEASEKSASKDAVYTGEVTLTASPNTGYTFVGWFSSTNASTALSTETTYTYNAPKSTKTVYARFKEDRYTVKVQTYTNGSATPTSNQYGGIATGVALTATPNTGYEFTGWTINSGSGSFGSASTASTSFYPTSNSQLKANFAAKTITVTLDGNEGTGGTATVKYNASSLTSITHATRAGYSLNGYYTASSGGSKVINADGSLNNVASWVSGGYWCKATDGTLYAQWTVDLTYYDVTFGVGTSYTSLGSLSATNNSTSSAISSGDDLVSGTSITFTASPNTGYAVEGWYTDAACTNGKHDAGSTTYSIASLGGDVTVYVKFVEKTWSVAFAAGTGGTVTTPNSTPQTVGQLTGISIAATPGTGYTFASWSSSSGGSFTEGASTNSNTFKPTANTTVTASFNETMSTLTTSCSYDAGNPSYAAPTVSNSATNVGYATTRTITATAAGTGYTFAGWTLTNCVRTDGGGATANPITVRSNGDGAAATVVANYTEDLTSPYTIKGGTNITGNNWSTSYNMTKKSGHSTESVVYYTFNISSTNSGVDGQADNWSFKVIKDGSTWYGLTADGDSWWYKRNSGQQTLSTSGKNIQLCADVAGPYEIKVDYSTPASPKITVTFPTKYTITYSVSPSGAANAITTSPSVVSGGSVAAGTSMTFTHAAAKTGYSWYRWENGSGSSLGTGNTYTTTINANTTVVAKYTENTYNVTATASTGGSATPASATSMGQITGGDITASPNTGYNFTNWTITSGSGYFGTSGTATTSTTANTKFRPTAAATIQANFTPKQTTITLNNQDATTSGTTEVTATFDAAMPAITLPTKTGYTFGGYWGAPGGGGPQYYNADGSSAQNWNNVNPTYTLIAKWTANSYTVTLDKQTSATGYGASGTCSDPTVTYNTALPAISGTMPSGTGAYGFAGFYTEAGGSGVKLINSDGTWVNNVTGYTSADGKWIHADNVTVYADYKQAEITGITLNADIFEPVEAGEEKVYVKADPNIDPTPSSTTKICWELRYSNDNPVEGHTPIVDNEGGTKPNQVKFELNGLASGGYKIHAELRSGSDCAGTLLSSYDQSFSIANDHTVTIYYRLGTEDGPVIKASTTSPGKPLDPTEISAPNIVGYTFSHWKAGDGVTIDAENDSDGDGISEDNTISYTAIYDGKLTAVYTKKRMIYFMNTLGWSGVTVYFYKNDSYWDASKGTGSSPTDTYTNTPFSESKYGAMTQIEGTNIWYLDAEAKGVNATYTNIVFTEETQYDYHFFSYQSGTTPNKVIRRGDYSPAMSMFVPLGDQEGKSMNSGQAYYYNEGYWMNYSENTGYTLRIYNSSSADNGTGASRTFTFPYSEDIHMPLKVDVDFNFTGSVWFMVYRHDGTLLGKSSTTLTQTNTSSSITRINDKVKIQTSAPGIYTFTLTFHDDGANPKNYNYYINVDYPVGVGDYRILYKDNDTWSQSTAHSASWSHPSDIIRKNTDSEEKSDTVSLFVSYGSTISAKFQKVTAINASTGAVTWADVASGTIDLSGITKKGVYNFIVSQPAGGESISLSKTEEYTGNFYIRTDCAGNTKWDNYRTRDHQMPYTDFSMSDANTFGDKFSHYYAHWCPAGTNIKFCVANDYSACISDTLTKDVGEPYKNLDVNGTLLSDGNGDATANRYSANVRFMYNSETNRLSRAYVSAATNAARKFLVLYCEDGKAILDENGNPLAGTGETSRQAIFHDNENFIYDRVLQIVPGTRFKLFASYALKTPTRMDSVQYFRGTYASDAFSSDENSVVLLSGTGGAQKIRVIYDFKTNRLVAAWMPSDEPISGTLDINADVMIIRDHHNAAECITFANSSSKLDGVKTVYGAMKFNRWTLNNRARGKNGIEDNNKDHCDTPEDITEYHPILNAGEQKSIYERSLYFISFPFNVKVSEIFGFGHYWDEWYLEYYDGLTRAQNGYWKDSPSNWKYVTPEMADTMVLRANQGYILGLDLDYMEYDNTTFWANNISNVELYFPSQTTISSIKQTEITIPALGEEYRCTINRGTSEGDRRIKDSFWRCIGVPSYDEFAGELKSGKGGSTINWQTSYSTFPFLYAWNMSDNTLTPQNTSTYAFKPMHAYLVQIQDAIYWNLVSATPAPIVARRERAENESEHNWCLTLSKDSTFVDQTYVRMSNLEQVTSSFDFNQDLIKEMNTSRSNIYTLVGYERLAANSMPIETTNTTIVPVGVNIKTAGEYTFAIPEGTNGIGITLVDTEANVRTSLSAFDYTVNLNAGEYDSRFILEISPISQIATGVEDINDPSSNVRKLMIDGILYIIRDGKMYDARGARVE